MPTERINSVDMAILKRGGGVLLVLAFLVQFAAGAHLFDSHTDWTRSCTAEQAHFCDDPNIHDSGPCAICVATGTGSEATAVTVEIASRVEQPLVSHPVSSPLTERQLDTSCPRGPPAPRA